MEVYPKGWQTKQATQGKSVIALAHLKTFVSLLEQSSKKRSCRFVGHKMTVSQFVVAGNFPDAVYLE